LACPPLAQIPSSPALHPLQWRNIGRLGGVALGTVLAGVVWLPFVIGNSSGGELVRWIQRVPQGWEAWTSPIVHIFASMVSMVYLLPIQGVRSGIVIGSSLIVLSLLLRTLWLLVPIGRSHLASLGLIERPPTAAKDTLPLLMVGGVVIGAVLLIATINYGLGFRVAEVFRYHFFYYPAVLLAIAWGLAQLWPHHPRIVGLTVGLALCGALTVAHNLGYQKIHRPDLAVHIITEAINLEPNVPEQSAPEPSSGPLFLAISYQSHGQTGRMMAIARVMQQWQVQQESRPSAMAHYSDDPRFFLDHQPCDRRGDQNCNAPSPTLRRSLASLPPRANLWLINYLGQTDLSADGCVYQRTRRVDGYKLQHYRCSLEG